MPPAFREIDAMSELQEFAERLSQQLLEQLRADHAEARDRNDAFRDEIRAQVTAIRESMAAMIAREEACARRLGTLETRADSATGKLIGLLIGMLASAGTAIWGLMRER